MRIKEALVLLALVGLSAGCSGTSERTALPLSNPDAGLASWPDPELLDPILPILDADVPDGAATAPAYPTTNIGGRPRSATQPGQIFPNLTLQGVRSAATIDTPATVSMAEFYDPDGARYDLLHVMAIFMWCPHCNNETSDVATLSAWQSNHRVAAVQIAMLGYNSGSGAAPTWAELQKWVSAHNLDFPVLIDGRGAQLGQYFSVDYVPINIVVNPRSMEVLAVDVGEVGDVRSYEQGFLSKL